jgi:hypothetical protein
MGDGRSVFYMCGLKRMYASVLDTLERLGKVGLGQAGSQGLGATTPRRARQAAGAPAT